MRIDERIADRYTDLSPQERRAADVLLDHLGDLATYRAAELADLAGVSKATMSRLFRSLGFDDFSEVRDHLRDLRHTGVPLTLDAVPGLSAHVEQEVDNLRRVFASLEESELGAIVELLADAERVVVVGMRSSYPVALHLRQQLAQARPGVSVAPQPGQSLTEDLVGLGAGDVCVVVGFRRRPDHLADVLVLLEAAGVPVVLLADATVRAHAPHVVHWIECPLTATSAFDSYAAAMSVVAVLANGVIERRGRSADQRVAAIATGYRALREIEEH